jgi:putative nucleotidyltransferase with HDIG domain
MRRSLYVSSQWALLAVAVGAAGLTSRPEDWKPAGLFILLLALSAVGERLAFTVGGQNLTASFIALVLAMALLGPAPAVAIGCASIAIDALTRQQEFTDWLATVATYSAYLVAGGLLVRLFVGDVHDPANSHAVHAITFSLFVFAVFIVTNFLNFILVAINKRVLHGRGLMTQIRTLFIPILPGQFAAAVLAAILAAAYVHLGYPVLLSAVVIVLIFQYLAVALLRSEDRADQLEARSIHLASLQLGVLTTLVETLALRDRTTARHAAAVARYARELAKEVDCDEAEQELVHTAGLLHDIGKFALPDTILRADVLSDEDWAVIRRHPQDGATLVGRLDGYGAVAEAILYHHENVDGSGYPAGLIGNEIPLASRIIAICSTYDTLTARETYRSPMTPRDAMSELRRVAGRQLDPELVERFIAMLEREGPVTFAHGDEADFAAELAFGRRARQIAQPTRR